MIYASNAAFTLIIIKLFKGSFITVDTNMWWLIFFFCVVIIVISLSIPIGLKFIHWHWPVIVCDVICALNAISCFISLHNNISGFPVWIVFVNMELHAIIFKLKSLWHYVWQSFALVGHCVHFYQANLNVTRKYHCLYGILSIWWNCHQPKYARGL